MIEERSDAQYIGCGTLSPRLIRQHGYNRAQPAVSRIRPVNFCLSVHVAEFGHPEGVDPARFHLIAPYSTDPTSYLALSWVNRFTGERHSTTVDETAIEPTVAVVRSYGSVFASFVRHAEAKSLDAEGGWGVGEGHLMTRPVKEGTRTHVGKESNNIEELSLGFLHRVQDVMVEYGRARDP